MTSLFRALVPVPGRGAFSKTKTSCPRRARTAAVARPTTPAPITATRTRPPSGEEDVARLGSRLDFRSVFAPRQLSFSDLGPLRADPAFGGLRRFELGQGAFVEQVAGWVTGADALFEELLGGVPFRQRTRRMAGREVLEPRLSAPAGPGELRRWPLLGEIAELLSARYGAPLRSCWLHLYRDGRDSVAWHGDRLPPEAAGTPVALVSLGSTRSLLLRPRGGGRSLRFALGSGDLLVMGGTCQQRFEHALPKVAHAGPRISVAWRVGRRSEVAPRRSGSGAMARARRPEGTPLLAARPVRGITGPHPPGTEASGCPPT